MSITERPKRKSKKDIEAEREEHFHDIRMQRKLFERLQQLKESADPNNNEIRRQQKKQIEKAVAGLLATKGEKSDPFDVRGKLPGTTLSVGFSVSEKVTPWVHYEQEAGRPLEIRLAEQVDVVNGEPEADRVVFQTRDIESGKIESPYYVGVTKDDFFVSVTEDMDVMLNMLGVMGSVLPDAVQQNNPEGVREPVRRIGTILTPQ